MALRQVFFVEELDFGFFDVCFGAYCAVKVGWDNLAEMAGLRLGIPIDHRLRSSSFSFVRTG